MTDTMPIPTLERFEAGRPALPRRRAAVPLRVALMGVALLGLLLGVGAAWASGLRVFVVESPSMGTAAPVGSLVIGQAGSSASVGDLITFQPPGSGSTPYTHRIVSTASDGFRTRGDINGAVDPWIVEPSMVIARATSVLPGVGWLVKAAPFLLGALVVAQVVGLFVRSPAVRWSIRTAALAVGVAFVAWVVKPFSGFVLLQSAAEDDGLRASIVSTAILPIRVSAMGGGHVDLVAGQVGRLLLPRGSHGRVTMAAQLDLDPLGWALVVLVCLIPLIVVLVVGVPVEEPGDAAT